MCARKEPRTLHDRYPALSLHAKSSLLFTRVSFVCFLMDFQINDRIGLDHHFVGSIVSIYNHV